MPPEQCSRYQGPVATATYLNSEPARK
ncbi:hypothetical protein A2U01_0098191, partial [Trifolium medium]|nr:hypothetical protein [Trifolium medium]